MGKFSYTWALMKESWGVLKADKEILIFPLLSGICCLIVLASFAVPLIAGGLFSEGFQERVSGNQVLYYAGLFLFYFCQYFVIVFFNSGTIACAVMRMSGQDPTVGDGFRAALARLPQIFGWALVSATVGVILRAIEDRSKFIGRLVVSLLGMAWTVVSFLVVPVLVVEKKGPIDALKESTALLRRTWGEQLIGHFSFGFVFFVLSLPAFVIIVLGILTANPAVIILCIAAAVLYLIIIALVEAALQAIFQAAVYLYARDGQEPEGFSSGLLADAMRQK